MQEYLAKLDKTLQEYLVKKAPALPKGFIEFLVAIAPWFAVLAVIMGIPAFLAVFGFSALFVPFALVAGIHSGGFWIFWLVGLAQVILAGMSIKPLFAKQKQGWQLLFYSQILSFITSLGHYDVGNLFATVISFYFLYQMKKSYFGKQTKSKKK